MLLIFCLLSLLALYIILILTVVNRLRIPSHRNGLQRILHMYSSPRSGQPMIPTWIEDFSVGVEPVPCHSHNDYWRRVPLYEAIYAGCISIEADVWFREGNGSDQGDVLVGYTSSVSVSDGKPGLRGRPVGIFDTAPDESLVLLLDFKTIGSRSWDAVFSQLRRLRESRWLIYWTPNEGLVQRPLTIVASGDASFEAVIRNETYRDIFYDAPLRGLADINVPYNQNNSYYSSDSLSRAVGKVTFGKFSAKQKATVASQTQRAAELGLKSRYWDTPSWPVGWRNRIWDTLLAEGVSVLNVDEVAAAARWDWQMCVILGMNVCSS
ncbi:hypothetical protein DL95DRAFT_427713 [Leptodontidium sp. 2 PMI_412]|nr:hypothetical protein DL95DRAFT_427713 [Leptodontidium sp. 2 PMI_412]